MPSRELTLTSSRPRRKRRFAVSQHKSPLTFSQRAKASASKNGNALGTNVLKKRVASGHERQRAIDDLAVPLQFTQLLAPASGPARPSPESNQGYEPGDEHGDAAPTA
nr:hypothetical protein B0A51_04386 [Rachicladosporium sp. CCFEE 5018]